MTNYNFLILNYHFQLNMSP